MKIGLISTYINSTPPSDYGGECFYWGLAKELGNLGHEVHLFATGGSETPPNGHLHLIRGSRDINYSIEEWVEKVYHHVLMDMDVIHDCSLDHIAAERLRNFYDKSNIINTINGSTYWMPRPPFNVVTGSKAWQEDAKKHGLKTEMVYWGIDETFYTPEGDKEDYFLWISRFHPDKGLDMALDLAEVMNIKLKVAGSMTFRDHAHYGQKYIERILSLPMVEYVELPLDSNHHAAKRELYRKARAFLYPVRYFECFGLVVVESLACGTPVIALNNGAMPELIDHGKNGFLCNTKTDMADAVRNLKLLDRTRLTDECIEKAKTFTWRKAAEQYVSLYERVMKGETW